MLRAILAACALLCALSISSADAKSRAASPCIETGDIMRPVCGMAAPAPRTANFLAGVKSIKVTMKRERRSPPVVPARSQLAAVVNSPSFGVPLPDLGYSIARPARYIAGRLICAVNVNSALAERGITGTGSAVAKSFLRWGRASAPVPGAVAVSSRRGGGHVAIVSRVEGGRIYVWNPSPRGRGWQEQAYRYRAISYRVPGW